MLKIIVDILQIISPQVYLILPIHSMMEMLHLLIFLHLEITIQYNGEAITLQEHQEHTLLKQGVTTQVGCGLWIMII